MGGPIVNKLSIRADRGEGSRTRQGDEQVDLVGLGAHVHLAQHHAMPMIEGGEQVAAVFVPSAQIQARRVSWSPPAAHSAIAMNERAPANTACTASPKIIVGLVSHAPALPRVSDPGRGLPTRTGSSARTSGGRTDASCQSGRWSGFTRLREGRSSGRAGRTRPACAWREWARRLDDLPMDVTIWDRRSRPSHGRAGTSAMPPSRRDRTSASSAAGLDLVIRVRWSAE